MLEEEIAFRSYSGEKESVNIFILPLADGHFVILFDYRNPFEFESGRFRINVEELQKLLPNRKIIDALKFIEQKCPLSLIEKKQLLRKLSSLTNAFWISSPNGAVILANEQTENFAAIASPAGEKEEDAFFKEVWNELKILNDLVSKSKSIAVKENVRFSRFENVTFDLIKFPVLDAKNEIVAVCGIIQESSVISLSDKNVNYALTALEKLPVAFAVFDFEGILTRYSEKFFEKFFANEKNIYGKRVAELFEKEFAEKINDFLLDENIDELSFSFEFIFEKEKIPVTLKKIYNAKNIFIGLLIIFDENENKNCSKILELKMVELLLDASPDPMFIYDVENLKFLAVNDAAVKFYGYSREQFLQMDLTDLYTPEDIQTLIEFNNSNATELEKPVKHKLSDGSTAIVRLSRKEIEFEERKAFLTLVKDVSKNVEINKNLRELNALLDFASEVVFETDAEGFITKVNRAVTKTLDYSPDDVTGKTFISLLSENDRAKVNKKIFLNKLSVQTELDAAIKTKLGATKKVKIVAVPLYDIFEEISGYSLIVIVEKSGVSTSEKVTVSDAGSGGESSSIDVSFLSHLFHEILTPINVIIGFTQELLESLENPTPEQKESAQIIAENQRALMQLIDAATEYVALDENRTRIKPEEFGIVEILDKIEENVKRIADSHGVELKYGKISSSILLRHDKHLLVMFLSLFWEFAVRGTKEKQVYFAAQPEGDYVVVNVKDDKKAASNELIRAMNEFLSEDETLLRRNYNVSRFAVRLFRKLAALLNVEFYPLEKNNEPFAFAAKIKAETEAAGGAPGGESLRNKREVKTFAAPETSKAKRVGTERATREVFAPSSSQAHKAPKSEKADDFAARQVDLSKLSCLLLEDQVDSQLLFKQQMKELKEIETFAKFEDALPVLRKKKFDFVVMDINLLGDYNGLEALREIKNIPQYRNVPVIASTAYMLPGDQDRYIEAGFDDFIPKPILKNKLIESLKKVLRK